MNPIICLRTPKGRCITALIAYISSNIYDIPWKCIKEGKNSLFIALRLNCSYKNKKRNNELILTQNKILPID